jgi:succinyl-diaminopimelate desuccinylase
MVEEQLARREALIRQLADLIRIESVNPYFPGGQRGEAAVAEYVAEHCRRLGLRVATTEVLPGRPNVLAWLTVPGATRTLLLDSHMDTVSLDLMGPDGLRPELRGGKLTGRGACDDKGPLAAMLAAMADLAEHPDGLGCNVLLLASVDEEYLMRGARHFGESGIKVDGAIVGEPTGLDLVVATKGFVRWRLHTRGRAAHSSNPQLGDNAIYQMSELIHRLRPAMDRLLADRRHPLVGPATWSIGKIGGGASVNIVPERCTVEIDRRLLPGESGATALADFDAVVKQICAEEPTIQVERDAPFGDVDGTEITPDSPVVRALAKGAQGVRGQAPIVGVPFGTNASRFAPAGIPCVVFGPGDIRQAHTADEYVEVDQVVAAAQIYAAAARAFGEISA